MENIDTDVQKLLTNIKELSDLQRKQLLNILKTEEFEERMSAGDKDAFREYLILYCTKLEDGELRINVPAKGKFKGFNFECNTRDLRLFLNEEYPSEDKNLGEKIAKLLYALEDYVKAYGIEMDDPEIQKHILNPILKKYHIRDN